MMELKKIGAWTILLTIIGGLGAEARHQIAQNRLKLARLEERHRSTKEILIEVKSDVKEIKSLIIRRKE